MSNRNPPDDESGSQPTPERNEPDAHGQAGLFLAESILHALIETRTLTLDQAIGVVRIAAEVKVEVAEDSGESGGRIAQSIGLLGRIERSLETSKRGPRQTE